MPASRDIASLGDAINGTANVNFDANTLFIDVTNNRVGIGTSSPEWKIHINDSAAPVIQLQEAAEGSTFIGQDANSFFIRRGTIGATNALTIEANGNVTISGTITAATITETSSIKLKENIRPISGGLEKIISLNGVTYDRKDSKSFNEPGLIAEDVIEVLPNLVVTDSEGNPESIQYTKLTAYLIEAVKELNQEVKNLRSKIKD